MSKEGFFTKVIGFIITITFLWTNCVWAGASGDKLAAKTQVEGVLRNARVFYSINALYSELITGGIITLESLYKNQDRIRENLRKTIGDAADNLKTIIFEGEGGIAYYIFSDDGYFYRFTTAERVDDPFNRLIEGVLSGVVRKPEKVKINGSEYYQEGIKIPEETFKLINICLKEIYPGGDVSVERLRRLRQIDITKDKQILERLYTQMKNNARVYTIREAAEENGISEADAVSLLEWLRSLDREIEPDGEFRGIEKVVKGLRVVYQWLNPDSINPDIFRDYDYRSPTRGGFDFSPKRVFFITLAWASMSMEKRDALGIDNDRVVIARDCRKTPKEVIEAMIKAIEYSGLQAIFVGEKYNCAASYAWAVRKHAPLMGIFLTASHVKAEDVMGAKVSIRGRSGELESLTTKEIKEASRRRLDEILRDPNYLGLIRGQHIEGIADDDVEPTYVQMATTVGLVASDSFKQGLEQRPSLYDLAVSLEKAGDILMELDRYKGIVDEQAKPLKGLRFVIEAAHTPSGKLARDVYEALGAEVIVLNEEILELTGQHKADPSIIDNLNELMDKIQETGAHLGLAFDLDGDRGAIVIPTQQVDSVTGKRFSVLPPDNLMQALLPFFDRRGYSVGERGRVAVVRDVLSTKGVDEKAQQLGYETFQTDAGYVYLKAKVRPLKEDGYTVPIYAERSGHAWTHATGAFEDPIVVLLFFGIMGMEFMRDHPGPLYSFSEAFQNNTIPYKQSTRFQPLFGEQLLRELSSDSGNDTGWTVDKGKPPMKIISMGRHRAIERLREVFQPRVRFNTPVGELVVGEFNFYFDEEAGINRYADIRFTLDGQDAGSFVFRASSNDPTWVCSFEIPLWPGETFGSETVQKRYDSVGGVVLDYLEKGGLARVAGEGFDYNNKADAEGTLRRYRGENVAVQGSHLVREVEEGEEEESLVYGITIDENGRLQISEEVLPDDKTSLLQELLDRLGHIYGPGIFTKIKEVRTVNNLKGERLYPEGRAPLASYKDWVLKIDSLLFSYGRYIIFEEVEHEFTESIAGIIPGCNETLADVVSTYRSVLRFLNPNMEVTDDKYKWNEDGYREGILSVLRSKGNPIDPDGEYLKLLLRLRELKNRNQLSEAGIIASVVRYAMRTKLYETVRGQLGLPSDLAKKIRDLDPGLDDMLQVLNEIRKAKEGEELVKKVKETNELAITAVKTFTGLRLEELDKISDELARMISAEARQVSSLNKVVGIVANTDDTKYILVSKERQDELIGIIGQDEYNSIERKLRDNGYLIRTEMPADINPGNIVRLRDPADELRQDEQVIGISYLTIPYTRTAFYMAADIVSAKGRIRDINPLVLNLIFDLYPGLRELPQDKQELFFTQPWHQIILDKIRPVVIEINNLRKAVAIIEKAA